MALYISGSMAYDRIMTFPGKFTDSILPDKLSTLNVSFCIDTLDERLGGNAGNIAYSLYLLQEKPIIIATVGRDFDRYEQVLAERKLPTEGITRITTDLTASAYITTDTTNNQITAFHGAAMLTPSTYKFPRLDAATDIALIGPSNTTDMRVHPTIYKQHNIRYVYDPAQQLPVLTGDDLTKAIDGAYLLIGNEYEIELIMNKTGKTRAELLAMTQAGLITTMSEKGSLVTDKNGKETHIAAVSITRIADPTGAGDAYRSGVLKGLSLGKSLDHAARLGATCAAFCLEALGTQGHTFSPAEFAQRHAAAFGEQPY